jgi:hypothetical protein
MRDDLNSAQWCTFFKWWVIARQCAKTPVSQKNGNAVPSVTIFLREVRAFTIKKEEFLKVAYKVPTLFMENVARLV